VPAGVQRLLLGLDLGDVLLGETALLVEDVAVRGFRPRPRWAHFSKKLRSAT
jgi:hypothetical protein